MNVTLHRYAPIPQPGDLTLADLCILWGLMLDENLVETFFHDGNVSSLPEFIRYATDPGIWFHGARMDGRFIGFGVANNFSSTGNTAFAHLCSFKEGRTPLRDKSGKAAIAAGEEEQGELCPPRRFVEWPGCPFADAGRQWFGLLRDSGGLNTVIAVFPACYRGLRQWVLNFGFEERMRLPGALRIVRAAGARVSDALVYSKKL